MSATISVGASACPGRLSAGHDDRWRSEIPRKILASRRLWPGPPLRGDSKSRALGAVEAGPAAGMVIASGSRGMRQPTRGRTRARAGGGIGARSRRMLSIAAMAMLALTAREAVAGAAVEQLGRHVQDVVQVLE